MTMNTKSTLIFAALTFHASMVGASIQNSDFWFHDDGGTRLELTKNGRSPALPGRQQKVDIPGGPSGKLYVMSRQAHNLGESRWTGQKASVTLEGNSKITLPLYQNVVARPCRGCYGTIWVRYFERLAEQKVRDSYLGRALDA
jgi:hypothetical protein